MYGWTVAKVGEVYGDSRLVEVEYGGYYQRLVSIGGGLKEKTSVFVSNSAFFSILQSFLLAILQHF